MPPKKIPKSSPWEHFKKSLDKKALTLINDGQLTEEEWGKAVKTAQDATRAKYGDLYHNFMFGGKKRLKTDAGIDLSIVPDSVGAYNALMGQISDFLDSEHKTKAQYDATVAAEAKAAAAAHHLPPPPHASLGSAASAAAAEALEEKDEEKAARLAKTRAAIKKARGAVEERASAYKEKREEYEDDLANRYRGTALQIAERLQTAEEQLPPSLALDLLSLQTGLDFSGVDLSKSTLATLAEQTAVATQNLALSSKNKGRYKYLGAFRGSLEAMLRGDKPINELDAAASIHDLEYLEASAIDDPKERSKKIIEADSSLLHAANAIANENKDEAETADAVAVVQAMGAKEAVEGVLGQWDFTTAGVRKLTNEELRQKARKISPEVATAIAKVKRDDLRQNLQDIVKDFPVFKIPPELEGAAARVEAAEAKAAATKAKATAKAAPLHSTEPVRSYLPPPPPQPLLPGEAAEPSEVQGGLSKREIGLEEVLSNLAKMNAPSLNPLSLTPVTGERNLRPLLVMGDTPNILKRTPKELSDNRNYYAAWKWVMAGAGNGNQQPLPDQVGMPANNRIIDMMERNQRFKFLDNYDGGAKQWYAKKKEVYGTYARTMPLIRAKYAIPMFTDSQRHQEPTRNGAVPCGRGRPIKMAQERPDGFRIFTPYQELMGKETRLFHGDIVDGRRV